jgi:hypothetical protein
MTIPPTPPPPPKNERTLRRLAAAKQFHSHILRLAMSRQEALAKAAAAAEKPKQETK